MTNQSGPTVGDAIGRVLRECWAAGCPPGVFYEFFERDDGYINENDVSSYFSNPGAWSSIARRACDRVTGRILDVGCGAGRYAAVLKQEGHDVAGLDPSAGAVAVAGERGVPAVVGTVLASPFRPGTFDTFLLLGNNVGLLGGATQAGSVLASLASLARPGAQLLGIGMDPYHTKDPAHLAYHERNRRRGRHAGQVRMRVRARDLATDWFDYLFVSGRELAELVAGSRWRLTAIDADGAAYLATLRLNG